MQRREFCHAGVAALLAGALLPRGVMAGVYAGLQQVDADLQALSLQGREQVLPRASVQELADSLRGRLLLPGKPAYDTARLVLNPVIDKHPALIVQPTGPADIQSAVQFAGANDLVVAVKCGGHSFSGKSTCDGGLLIDLSSYRNVQLDTQRRLAYVTGGSLLGAIDHETLARGLVTTAGTVSHTGVGGLATGGGFGRVARRFGLALDNIRAVDVVTADGSFHHADGDQNSDLYWGVRGGGGNFGVVSNFTFDLHPMQREVIGGKWVYPIDRARDVLEAYAEHSMRLPDAFYLDCGVGHPPGDGPGFAVLDVCYSGPPADFERLMQPFRALGKPLKDSVGAVDYVALQRSGDFSDPRAMVSYVKDGFCEGITPALIDSILQGLEPDPGRLTQCYFQHAGGAIGRVAPGDTAFSQRYVSHDMMVILAWPPEADGPAHRDYIRAYWKQLEPHTRGFYTNVAEDNERAAQLQANFEDNFQRLVALKNRYDPRNLFRLNANIEPTV
ncbi:FAD-binding oxidoreductase [Parahaliea mediterranea]|uniref:FAD-binding oxidoreductase n=1 Tax=Parahaliea mediterranea TaxID=651086 RepID=A0A939DEM7_9GAMM|nr:FAD-binding protein [Parahaliea mediterranea]MBN7796729.1 FAD-binding oxidoreductase [Parahaliea mediterranea]